MAASRRHPAACPPEAPYTSYDLNPEPSAEDGFCRVICLRADGVSGRGAGEPELCSDGTGGLVQCAAPAALPLAANPTFLEDCCQQVGCRDWQSGSPLCQVRCGTSAARRSS